jgi:O-acetyl-ADP-ribose deacetylase (regulator of RNase III)
MDERIKVVVGDITVQDVDAIVNAANNTLMGGGGVDGAIHRAAGSKLVEECLLLNGCPTGEAKITGGYDLPARHVIHTVGPVWHGGSKNEENLLGSCYRRCMELAAENFIRTIAFPAISTGAYGFPQERAAAIAVFEIRRALRENELPEKVIFVCFDQATRSVYGSVLASGGLKIFKNHPGSPLS